MYYSTRKFFNSHAKSSLHRLTFKPQLNCTQYFWCLNSISLLRSSYPGWLASQNWTAFIECPQHLCSASCLQDNPLAQTTQKALPFYWWRGVFVCCRRYLATHVRSCNLCIAVVLHIRIYLGITLTDVICTHEGYKNRLNLESALIL
jgi:hypothetical protein